MGNIIIPSNQIITNYTIGNEYVNISTYENYQGYYYEFNGKIFAGKEFNPTASVLIKKDSTTFNPLLSNPVLSSYGKLTNLKSNVINSQKEPPYIDNTLETPNYNQKDLSYSAYFYGKIVDKQVLIKQISQKTYNDYKNNPAYNVIEIKLNEGDTTILPDQIEKAEKQIPGFTDWYISNPNITTGGIPYFPSDFIL